MLSGRASWLLLSAAKTGSWSEAMTDPLTVEDLTDEEKAATIKAGQIVIDLLDNDQE